MPVSLRLKTRPDNVMARVLIIIATVLMLGGCVSVKKQRSRAHDFFREHPAELAELCGDKFPAKTEYLPGKPIVKTDTTVVTDTVKVDCPDGTQVDCPPNKTITIRDTVTIRDTIKQENTARLEQYRLEAERLARLSAVDKALLEQAEQRARKRGWVIGGLLAAAAVYFILKGRRII